MYRDVFACILNIKYRPVFTMYLSVFACILKIKYRPDFLKKYPLRPLTVSYVYFSCIRHVLGMCIPTCILHVFCCILLYLFCIVMYPYMYPTCNLVYFAVSCLYRTVSKAVYRCCICVYRAVFWKYSRGEKGVTWAKMSGIKTLYPACIALFATPCIAPRGAIQKFWKHRYRSNTVQIQSNT